MKTEKRIECENGIQNENVISYISEAIVFPQSESRNLGFERVEAGKHATMRVKRTIATI
jgi:hypothetical protein